MSAAVHLRRQLHARIAAPHVQCAHTLRPVHLVRLIDMRSMLSRVHVHRNFAGGLRPVGVEQHARSLAILPISRIGWITPISLLACMMLMSTVFR